MPRRRILIMGAAGRDFHNFNTAYRNDRQSEVVAFTATQIPNIEGRRYPAALAGRLYPRGIPIFPESDLRKLIRRRNVDEVVFAYSDVSFDSVMAKASLAMSAGADFKLLGPESTMLRSRRPVIAVVAVRTGCGKSQTSREVCHRLRERGLRVAAIRHPMPYGDLRKQRVQRFASIEDLRRHECTIEEMEEYEPHIAEGTVVFAGVDYAAILREAEREADVIVWDGGNNDLPFYRPDLTITVADPHRPGHETRFHPGATNLLMADVVIINKTDSAPRSGIRQVEDTVRERNPAAQIIKAASSIHVEDPSLIRGRRVLVVEDGPTLTHGDMSYGAGIIAARRHKARAIVDPRRFAVASIKATYEKYPTTGPLLPAMGYSAAQLRDLRATIRRTPADSVVIGTPIDLRRVIKLDKPATRVSYSLAPKARAELARVLETFLRRQRSQGRLKAAPKASSGATRKK
jgi:predicted GTPase